MDIRHLEMEGLLLIEPDVYTDNRGYFIELFNENTFSALNLPFSFCQDNLSVNKKNVIRGLHFQDSPFAQGKLVRVIKGAVLDVVVDLREDSPSFGKHFSVLLSEYNNHMLWIPPGFAHGFAVIEDQTVFHYKCTEYYNKIAEKGIRFDDPDLAINWNTANPIVSEKDMELITFTDYKRRAGTNSSII
jgi:dTDP-4-dehydrorhamnose 3,5-epimerase